MKTAGVILAAGASRRLGSPKQLAVVGGERLLERALGNLKAAELDPIIVVLGANAQHIQQECNLSAATVVINKMWESGAASSIHAGLAALEGEQMDAVVLTTCDMPFVTSDHLQALVALAKETKSDAASRGTDWQGVPACFLRGSFATLLALEGDAGARKLLVEAPAVRLENDLDIDTPENLVSANNWLRK